VAVSIRLLETLTVIAHCLVRKAHIAALRLQPQTIRDASDAYPMLDRRAVEARYHALMEALAAKEPHMVEPWSRREVTSLAHGSK